MPPTIRQLLAKNIDRRIEKVITFGTQSEDQLKHEVAEYIATDHIEQQLDRLINLLDDGMNGQLSEVGVWVSGFYGSGKSSFTKYLGYALDSRVTIGDRRFLDYFADQLRSITLKQHLRTLAAKHDPAVVMVDLASQMVTDNMTAGISSVLYHRVMQLAGYAKDRKIAYLERMLERDGRRSDFEARISEMRPGKTWDDLKNEALAANSLAARLATEFYPALFPDRRDFQNIKLDEMISEEERVREMLDVLRQHAQKDNILFILDEVGQYVAASDPLILNLDGLAKNIKAIGKGHAWLLATAQQTLTEDQQHAKLNSDKLFKLKDRFPVGIDLESRDIREITHKRLLSKTADAEHALGALYDQHGKQLAHHTKLTGTRYYSKDLDRTAFIQLYPFLPQHFDILLELLARLSRSTGGMGLRSAIRVIQDTLIGNLGDTEQALANQPQGDLATTVTFYDILRRDVEKAYRYVVQGVERAEKTFAPGSVEVQVAKTVAVLQLLEDFPVTRDHVAALMYPRLGAPSLLEPVKQAVDALLDEPSVPLSEVDDSLRFMNEAVADLDQQRRKLIPSGPELKRLRNARLADLFSPLPRVNVFGSLTVKAGLQTYTSGGRTAIEGDKEEVQVLVDLVPENMYDARKQELLGETTQSTFSHTIVLLAPEDRRLDELLEDLHRSTRIVSDNRGKGGSKEVNEYLRGQEQRTDRLTHQSEQHLASLLSKGVFIFRGQPTPADVKSGGLTDSTQQVLRDAATEIYHKHPEAALQADTGLAERLLTTEKLDRIPSKYNPLQLIKPDGTVDIQHEALQSLLDYVRTREYPEGRQLMDHFTAAPFAWSRDTIRYLIAALLMSGEIVLRKGGETIKVRGPQATEALKNTNAFKKTGVALRDGRPSIQSIMRASKRLLELTGEKVMPLEDDVSKAVLQHFPDFRDAYSTLAVRLSNLALPGSDRAQAMLDSISELLKGDASDAAARLGGEACPLADDLAWARDVTKALDQGIGTVVGQANTFCQAIPSLPQTGPIGAFVRAAQPILDTLTEKLATDDFFAYQTDLQQGLTAVKDQLTKAAQALYHEQQQQAQTETATIHAMTEWTGLGAEDKERLTQHLEGIVAPVAPTLDGVQAAVYKAYEMQQRIQQVREEVLRLYAAIEPLPPDGEDAIYGEDTPEPVSASSSVINEPAARTQTVSFSDLSKTVHSQQQVDALMARLETVRAALADGATHVTIDW
ncbi:MAG: BREX system P-loop protein BrxC [Bacteroidota bacterium]